MASIVINPRGKMEVRTDITSTGRGPSRVKGTPSEGEDAPAGSKYTAILVQRPNISINQDQFPDRDGSGTIPEAVPVVSMAMRHTGRVG